MKVLAVADSDSYLKWAACLLDGLHGTAELAIVRTPIAPSPGQIRAALAGTRAEGADLTPIPARRLRRFAERLRPDAVLVACTGPVVDVLVADVLAGLRPRPVFVSGLPGISVPATERAWLFRGGCDLFVVHSTREVAEFTALAETVGGGGTVALARLPFLGSPAAAPPADRPGTTRNRVVFATQAKVPRRREEREGILLALADLAGCRPDLDVVVKLRARHDERQTHNERHHYELLWRSLAERGRVRPDAVRFADGSMREHLQHAAGFVTVSSTAALEAIAASVPLIVLEDFGVNAEMINLVFADSGCLGRLDDLVKGAFRTPSPTWCRANYFHPPSAADWTARLAALVADAHAGRLVPAVSLLGGPAHAAARRRVRLRMEVPPPMLRAGYRAKRRVRHYRRHLRPG